MVTGAPGSGKTTLGLELSRALRLPFLSRDHVRGGMLATAGLWTNEVRSPAPREIAVEAFVQLVEGAAGLGISAVIEFVVFRDRVEALERLVAAAGVLVIHAQCEDAAARADRRDLVDPLLNRPTVLAALGHASVDAFLRATVDQRDIVRNGMQNEFALPTLTVRTDDGYDPQLPEILDWIVEQTRR
jgi:hypothetical protein